MEWLKIYMLIFAGNNTMKSKYMNYLVVRVTFHLSSLLLFRLKRKIFFELKLKHLHVDEHNSEIICTRTMGKVASNMNILYNYNEEKKVKPFKSRIGRSERGRIRKRSSMMMSSGLYKPRMMKQEDNVIFLLIKNFETFWVTLAEKNLRLFRVISAIYHKVHFLCKGLEGCKARGSGGQSPFFIVKKKFKLIIRKTDVLSTIIFPLRVPLFLPETSD